MTIAILCPTKGRPEQFKRMVESVRKTADLQNVMIYPCVNGHETSLVNGATNRDIVCDETVLPEGMPTVHRWNYTAMIAQRNANHKLFMLGADDTIFATPHFDKALLDAYNALGNKIHVFALQDSRDKLGTPHPIVTREWIEAMGWFIPPIFLHWYIDSWTVEIAKSAGCFTHLKDYLLIHDKPSDKGECDATHTGIRAMGWHERDKWVAGHCQDWLELQKHKLYLKIRAAQDMKVWEQANVKIG